MKKNNIPGYPGYYLSRKGNLWRFKKGEWVKVKRYISPKLSREQLNEVVRLYDSGKFTLKELSLKFNCKNMSRIVRRMKGEIVR